MELTYFPSIFLSFCVLITIITQTKCDDLRYITDFCSLETNNFPPNNTYNSTLNTLLQYLTSNATTEPTGFYSTSVYDHTIHNTFNAYFLCRGDLNRRKCHDCVSTAAKNKSSCPQSVRETIYYDKCLIRYSNDTLDGVLATSPHYHQIFGDVPGNRDDWVTLLGNTFQNLASQAAKTRSGRKYASTSVSFNALTTLYALAQCKPDLSVSNCLSCLTNAIGQLQVRAGENYLTPACFIRYEIYPFFKARSRIKG